MFDMSKTKVVASPIANAFSAVFETASTGHMPNTCTNTGLSFHSPLINSSVEGLFFKDPKNPVALFLY
jgi:hypothetical protein